jgi:AcrR family transcriptional regulator
MSPAAVESHQRARLVRGTVEAVAERGYDAVTIRRLAELCCVSTRTLYKHHPGGKEDCLIEASVAIAKRLASSVAEAAGGWPDREERARAMLRALMAELVEEPKAAHLLLVDAPGAGPAAAKHARQATRVIGTRLAAGLDNDAVGAAVPRLLGVGLGFGVLGIARSRLLSGNADSLLSREVSEELSTWVLAYRDAFGPHPVTSSLPSSSARLEGEGVESPAGDRALLLTAVMKVASAEGVENLTPRMIYSAAGVTCQSFQRNFESAKECLALALELRVRVAIKRASRAAEAGASPEERLQRAVLSLCLELDCEDSSSGVGLDNIAAAGERGVRIREELLDLINQMIEAQLLASHSPRVIVEASTNALWGTLEFSAATDIAAKGAGVTRSLAYLTLAPLYACGWEPQVDKT